MINILDNPGPKTPFTIGETQLHTIDILEKLFHNAQLQQPNATVVTREGPMVATQRVPATALAQRLDITVAPLRVIEHRVSVISQGGNIEYIILIEMVENEKVQQQLHWYITIITQL